jgi:hypothetical protein
MGVSLFCSYARKDKVLLDELRVHLKPLEREGLIEVWYDRDISAGTEWEREVSKHLDAAGIILLLVGPDFMGSEYCYGIEMQRALERHQRGEARVIPIILRPCDWFSAPFAKLQMLPADATPVTQWSDHDKAWLSVTQGIRGVLEGRGKRGVPLSEEQEVRAGPASLSSFSLSKRGVVSLLGVVLMIILLLSVILWRYASAGGSTPLVQLGATVQATGTSETTHTYAVKNTDETPPDGVYFRHSLHPQFGQPTPTPIYGFGVFKADLVQVSCWAWGDDVYGDRIWYYVYNVTRPSVAGRSDKGWISAHYVNDGMAANHPVPGIPQCGNPLPVGG